MSHPNEQNPLSEPLRVDTNENNVNTNDSNYYQDNNHHNGNNNDEDEDDTDSLGPLPAKWEKAYTESGEVYFIDHSTGTSHWLDPRLSKFQKKSLEDCLDDELPYGWEKISDPHYGTYFIDHVNRRTQYENPVIQAKRAASATATTTPTTTTTIPSTSTNQQADQVRQSRSSFTKDPNELCGDRFRTSLVKSSRGLGFTIVGGDDSVDEFLQIKSVVPKGPAWLDGQLQTGDVIVFVNDTCVLGYTHNQIVRLFQSISVGSTVSLEVCRGYPLPFDPNDPNTEVVTTIAVDEHLQTSNLNDDDNKHLLDTNYNFLDGDDDILLSPPSHRDDTDTILDTNDDIDDLLKGISGGLTLGKVEVRVRIVKGHLGFGFTIADSACGQRVKKILDRQRCKNLMEGDILLEINNISLLNMSHDDVVQVLKNCPYNSEATICVQRGYTTKNTSNQSTQSTNVRNKTRKMFDNRYNNCNNGIKDMLLNTYRSKTPTADIYSTQTREILPSRPKTPLVDTRSLSKTPIKDFNSNNHEEMYNNSEHYSNRERNRLRLSLIDNQDDDDIAAVDDIDTTSDNNIQNKSYDYSQQGIEQKYGGLYIPIPHRFDCNCFNCTNQRNVTTNTINTGTGVNEIKNNYYDWWYNNSTYKNEYITTAVTLNRQETGFGFRIVGGIEDKSQVAVGHIVAGGAADLDGRIRSGDEIVSVDGYSVLKASHRQVVQFMNSAAMRGQVNLILRRRIYPPSQLPNPYSTPNWPQEHLPPPHQQQLINSTLAAASAIPPPSHTPLVVIKPHPEPTYDVTVQRTENEGFGFVIISSINKIGSTIGRLIEDSPAEKCGRLRVGDYIVAVNHINIMHLSHGDIVNLIKESGLSVTLTIAPNPDL